MKSIEIHNIQDFVAKIFEPWLSSSSLTGLWWRGQGQEWPLLPQIHRPGYERSDEISYALKFMLAAPSRYQKCPSNDDLVAWLFLMQHYGLPTRLLDWTRSPLAAAFFAVRELRNTTGVIFALDSVRLNELQGGKPYEIVYDRANPPGMVKRVFSDDFPEEENVLAIVPDHIDLRVLVQQSTFTIHGTPTPLEKLPNSDKFLRKLLIPAESKSAMEYELRILGFKNSSPFPDLEQLARDIKMRYL